MSSHISTVNTSIFTGSAGEPVWVGLRRTGGNLQWHDGYDYTTGYKQWVDGHPISDKDCAFTGDDQDWESTDCTGEYRALC